MNFAEKAVFRFWMNLKNGLKVLLKENTIEEQTTVGELMKLIDHIEYQAEKKDGKRGHRSSLHDQ